MSVRTHTTKFVLLGLAALSVSTLALVAPAFAGPKPHHAAAPTLNIVQTAAGNKDFSTLVAAVTAAGLGGTLSSPGPFTVFAPTDAAFAKLPPGTVATLVKPENKATLTKILTYHVVAGKVSAEALVGLIQKGGGHASVTTVQGEKLTANLVGGKVILTDAKGGKSAVTTTDINTTNGVIHVIDTVVMPK
jgi:uncharacterized surface protein with fasciclin (FAS1) repeats